MGISWDMLITNHNYLMLFGTIEQPNNIVNVSKPQKYQFFCVPRPASASSTSSLGGVAPGAVRFFNWQQPMFVASIPRL